mmetsp:Transcript_31078/g.68837  ORF Transcript_31078/g.68837 Transcript_31078/m.68837 type:complete len:198 (+) Transcript_31078:271-864(+)
MKIFILAIISAIVFAAASATDLGAGDVTQEANVRSLEEGKIYDCDKECKDGDYYKVCKYWPENKCPPKADGCSGNKAYFKTNDSCRREKCEWKVDWYNGKCWKYQLCEEDGKKEKKQWKTIDKDYCGKGGDDDDDDDDCDDDEDDCCDCTDHKCDHRSKKDFKKCVKSRCKSDCRAAAKCYYGSKSKYKKFAVKKCY